MSYVRPKIESLPFVEDTNIVCIRSDSKDITLQFNEGIPKLHAWVNANQPSLNTDKTNFMLLIAEVFSHAANHIVINQTKM